MELEESHCQLLRSQKLESVGQLAAGIAHEINTPTQYVGDNTRFLTDAFTDLIPVLDAADELVSVEPGTPETLERAKILRAALQHADVEFLREEIPRALEQSREGIARVSRIVQAMKEFSHPGIKEMTYVDLNRAIESTVTVASNEWKYVAEVEMDLDPELPEVCCLPGELNQVILNLIVNASHAIGDVVQDGSEGKGSIRISTRHLDDQVELRIEDTGTGIEDEVRERVFDPFFTTKEVGKGTGQGLSIAHDVVVNQHRGKISLETEVGKGTAFTLQIPVDGPDSAQVAA